jgi:hypothetical protein
LGGYFGDFFKDYVKFLLDFIRYSIAEAVITWIISLPLIILTIIALLDHSLKEFDKQAPPLPTVT